MKLRLLPALLLCAAAVRAQTVVLPLRIPAPPPGFAPVQVVPPVLSSVLPVLSALQTATALPSLPHAATVRVRAGAAVPVRTPPAAAARPLPSVETGDLLFLDFGRGDYYDAVADPTLEQYGVEGPRLHHAGLVEVVDGEPFVWEAWPMRGVGRVPLAFFLSRVQRGEGEPGGYLVGRLRPEFRALGFEAARRAEELRGLPFGTDLSWESRELYCSKLIAVLFAGTGLFAPRPMHFGREGTPERAFWEEHFSRLGLPVPEGQPGLSPLGLYLEGREKIFLSRSS
ncbi:MAG: YiiX/YebB-like N1pC/P60 family cysteine hydrolase [Elusimicrobiota bacterium]|jgi:hypothetical protein